jgi:hypothetical protein
MPYSASSSSSLRPGIAYDPESQRLRSTLLQRSEQNGRESGVDGLPQIGHGRPGGLPEGALPFGSAGIQPAEADRKTFAAEQGSRLI